MLPVTPLKSSAISRAAFVHEAESLCRERGGRLLFLTIFGAHLYGTALPQRSDLDIRGLFLPSRERIPSLDAQRNIHVSSAPTGLRNTPQDIDYDLYALPEFVFELLPQGEIGALDLLFSLSHTSCILYKNSVLEPLFTNPSRFIDPCTMTGYTSYVTRQTNRYGMQGTRGGALKNVNDWINGNASSFTARERLLPYLDEIATVVSDENYCRIVEKEQNRSLFFCGKTYEGSMFLKDFCASIARKMEEMPSIGKASQGMGLDFKALSHAVRALDEMEELLQTGRITFPLHTRELLLAIKSGAYSWPHFEKIIVEKWKNIQTLQKQMPSSATYARSHGENLLEQCYALGHSL